MWCCKRLDASDWPVTTVVRGNVSCLHVAAAASLTFETPAGLLFCRCLFPLFLTRALLQLLTRRIPLIRRSAASLLHRKREKERKRESPDGRGSVRIPVREEGTAGGLTKVESVHAKRVATDPPARELLEFWRDVGRDSPRSPREVFPSSSVAKFLPTFVA